MRSFRQRLTPAMAAIMGLLTAASLLAAIQLFLVDLPAAAAAVLLVGGALVLLAWKVQATSVMTQELKRRLAALSQQVPAPATDAAPSAPVVTAPIAGAPIVTAPVVTALAELTDALPAPSTPAHGPSRQLFVALHGDGSQPNGRAIALVGSSALASRLAAHGPVQRLHPLLSADELECARASALVVEEDAMGLGPWTGALAPHGAALLAELRESITWVQGNRDFVYVLPATGSRQPSAAALRFGTIVLDGPALAAHAHDAPPSLLRTLAAHQREAASL